MTSIGARRRATSEASARACSASMAQASLPGMRRPPGGARQRDRGVEQHEEAREAHVHRHAVPRDA